MIPNEIIFLIHALLVTIVTIAAARYGQQALVSCVVLFTIIANLFVTQTIVLCRLTATSTDTFIIGANLALILLQENYGKSQARRAILISFAGMVIFTLFSLVHLWYLPAPTDSMRPAFAVILSTIPRILGASATAYVISEWVNTWLYSWLQKRTPPDWFLVKVYGSIICAQILDTILFSILGLYNVVGNIGSIIAVSLSIKLAILLVTAPLVALLKKLKLIRGPITT